MIISAGGYRLHEKIGKIVIVSSGIPVNSRYLNQK
jgi:hypothetical protein